MKRDSEPSFLAKTIQSKTYPLDFHRKPLGQLLEILLIEFLSMGWVGHLIHKSCQQPFKWVVFHWPVETYKTLTVFRKD